MSTRIRLGALVFVLTFVAGLLGPVGQGEAAAASSRAFECRGSSCIGLDPAAMGCGGDAVTVYDTPYKGGWWEARFSPGCDAGWLRFSTDRPVEGRGYIVGYSCADADASCRGKRASMSLEDGGFTVMLSSVERVRLCWHPSSESVPGPFAECGGRVALALPSASSVEPDTGPSVRDWTLVGVPLDLGERLVESREMLIDAATCVAPVKPSSIAGKLLGRTALTAVEKAQLTSALAALEVFQELENLQTLDPELREAIESNPLLYGAWLFFGDCVRTIQRTVNAAVLPVGERASADASAIAHGVTPKCTRGDLLIDVICMVTGKRVDELSFSPFSD